MTGIRPGNLYRVSIRMCPCSIPGPVARRPPLSSGVSAVVDKNAARHGTQKVAEAYLRYLYTDVGQEIAAKNFYRPRNPAIAAKYAGQFPSINLITIGEVFGGWQKAQLTHFSDGGIFDQIYAK